MLQQAHKTAIGWIFTGTTLEVIERVDVLQALPPAGCYTDHPEGGLLGWTLERIGAAMCWLVIELASHIDLLWSHIVDHSRLLLYFLSVNLSNFLSDFL